MKNFPAILILDNEDVIEKLIKQTYGEVHLQLEIARSPVEAMEAFISRDIGLLVIRDSFESSEALEFREQVFRMQDDVQAIVLLSAGSDPMAWMNLAQTTLLKDTASEKEFRSVLDEVFNNLQRKKQIEVFENEKENEFEFLKNVLQEQQIFFLIADRSGTVEFSNKAVESYLNLPHYSLREEYFPDYLEDGLKVWNYAMARLGNRGDRYIYEFILKNSLGELKPIKLAVYEILDPRNRDLVVFEGLIPGDAQKDSKLDVNALNLIRRFSSGIADEIINPVNIIMGRLQLVAQKQDIAEDLKHSLEIIENQVMSIHQSTQRLVAFARLREDSVPQSVNLNELLNTINSDAEFQSNIDLNIQVIEGKSLPVLSGLREHFSILIETIVIEISKDLDPGAKLIISTNSQKDSEENEYVNLTIEDDQRSDVEKVKQQMILPHFTMDAGDDSVGIANTLISTIIDRYDGSLSVRSSKRGGTVIKITFPVK